MQIETTSRGILSALFRQYRIGTSIFLLIFLGGFAYAMFATPLYEASGSLLVRFGRDATLGIVRDGSTEIISQDDRREIMQSDVDILKSHDLLLDVVRSIGAERMYPGVTEQIGMKDVPEEAVIDKLVENDLIIKSSQQSNVIDVSLLNANPEVTAEFIHQLFERYIAHQSQVFNKPQINFMQAEVTQAKTKLEASQKRLRDFKAKNGISLIDEELAELLRQKSDAGTVGLESIDDAWDNLSQLQEKEKQMLMTYREDSPQVQRVKQSVALAERQLRQRQTELQNRTGAAATKIDKRIAALESKRSQYNDLARQVEIDETNYKNYQARGEDARINEMLNRKNITPISVVDEPVVPLTPVRPRRLLVLAISLLAGALFGSGFALAFEIFDPRFTSPEQLKEVLGVPLMASFPLKLKGAA